MVPLWRRAVTIMKQRNKSEPAESGLFMPEFHDGSTDQPPNFVPKLVCYHQVLISVANTGIQSGNIRD